MTETYDAESSSIFDGMAVLPKLNVPSGVTFEVVSDKFSEAVTCNPSKRTDVVFDRYRDISIKNVERARRSPTKELNTRTFYQLLK